MSIQSLPEKVTVAPLVLLSVVDHYSRISQINHKRVLGAILGDRSGDVVRVTNSFAVPFDEDPKNPDVWYLDHNFIETMRDMFKKINAKERLIGWYHSGARLQASDMAINELMKQFTPNPLLLVVDVKPVEVGIPTNAYYAVDEVKADGSSAGRTFLHVPSEIRAEEAEEIGVEHLLRDVHNSATGTLAVRLSKQLSSLRGLKMRLQDISLYLKAVSEGKMSVNHEIIGELQTVFNLLPNLSSAQDDTLDHAFTIKTNDQLMVVYLASLVRAIISFHDMIDNKLENKRKLNSVVGSDANTASNATTAANANATTASTTTTNPSNTGSGSSAGPNQSDPADEKKPGSSR